MHVRWMKQGEELIPKAPPAQTNAFYKCGCHPDNVLRSASHPRAQKIVRQVKVAIRLGKVLCFFCHHGRHRSVGSAVACKNMFLRRGWMAQRRVIAESLLVFLRSLYIVFSQFQVF